MLLHLWWGPCANDTTVGPGPILIAYLFYFTPFSDALLYRMWKP